MLGIPCRSVHRNWSVSGISETSVRPQTCTVNWPPPPEWRSPHSGCSAGSVEAPRPRRSSSAAPGSASTPTRFARRARTTRPGTRRSVRPPTTRRHQPLTKIAAKAVSPTAGSAQRRPRTSRSSTRPATRAEKRTAGSVRRRSASGRSSGQHTARDHLRVEGDGPTEVNQWRHGGGQHHRHQTCQATVGCSSPEIDPEAHHHVVDQRANEQGIHDSEAIGQQSRQRARDQRALFGPQREVPSSKRTEALTVLPEIRGRDREPKQEVARHPGGA